MVIKDIQPTVSEAFTWCVVANIVREQSFGPEGGETKPGSKHFKPGAKVYIIDWYAGLCDSCIVIGRHRKSLRYITLAIKVKHLENFRVKKVYNPAVIRKAKKHVAEGGSPINEGRAKMMCEGLPEWKVERRFKLVDV